MSTDLVVVEDGPITTIRLQNPPLNLVTVELTKALDSVLEAIESNQDVRCVIVT
jgi:enoyl-CoA hydratase/carnithine racemase